MMHFRGMADQVAFDDEHVLIAILGGMEEAKAAHPQGTRGSTDTLTWSFSAKQQSQDATEDYNGGISGGLLRISHWTGDNLGPHTFIL